jgi:hypothetical protein
LGAATYVFRLPFPYRMKVFLSVSLVFFLSSMLFFGGEGALWEWVKHVFFYAGQIFFYFFIRDTIRAHLKTKNTDLPHLRAGFALPVFFQDWKKLAVYVTEQGIQHFLAVPIYFAVSSIIYAQKSLIASSNVRKTLRFFEFAMLSFVMIHVGEFFVETHGLFPVLEGDPIEGVEFFWYFLSMFLIIFGVKRLAETRFV